MRAIILAAGRGRRLEASNPDGRPKCLLHIGGKSLLQRQLQALFELGITHADLVVGHQADLIIEHVATLEVRPQVAFHHNPRFELGSVLSLSAANDALLAGQPVLLLDADVLFHPHILSRLIDSDHQNCFLLDRHFIPGDEPVKIAIAGQRMVEFRKQLPAGLEYDCLGESVGFFRFSPERAAELAERCRAYDLREAYNAPHEEVLRDLLLGAPQAFGFEDISGLPWIEVDFAEDINRAEREILPAIRRDFPGY